jgi:hypothetical protein
VTAASCCAGTVLSGAFRQAHLTTATFFFRAAVEGVCGVCVPVSSSPPTLGPWTGRQGRKEEKDGHLSNRDGARVVHSQPAKAACPPQVIYTSNIYLSWPAESRVYFFPFLFFSPCNPPRSVSLVSRLGIRPISPGPTRSNTFCSFIVTSYLTYR